MKKRCGMFSHFCIRIGDVPNLVEKEVAVLSPDLKIRSGKKRKGTADEKVSEREGFGINEQSHPCGAGARRGTVRTNDRRWTAGNGIGAGNRSCPVADGRRS